MRSRAVALYAVGCAVLVVAVASCGGRRSGAVDDDAAAWLETARTHRENGEREAAVAAYEEALCLFRRADNRRGAAESLHGLFLMAWHGSDFRRALAMARKGAAEAAAAGDPGLESRALRSLLVLRYDLGDLEGARRALQRAEALVAPGDAVARARLLAYEGAIRLDEARPALARDALEQALALAGDDRPRHFYRSNHINLVQANLELGDLGRAEAHLAAAEAHAEPDGSRRTALSYSRARLELARGDHAAAAATLRQALGADPIPDWAWRLYDRLGAAERAGSERGAAEAAYERAIAVVETMRRELGSDELKPWLLERKRRPYEALFALLAEAGRATAALDVLERAKARAFLDAFLGAGAEPAKIAVEPAKIAAEPVEDAEPAAARLAAVELLLPALTAAPAMASRELDQILEAVGERQILLYFRADGHYWLAGVASGRVAIHRLATADRVERLASRFAARQDHATAEALGELLLPAAPLPGPRPLAPRSTVFVVADGALGALPFAALRRGGRFLVEDHALAYVPSLGALAAIVERAAGRDRGTAGAAAVLGDPRGDLPAAAREAEEVAARLGVRARLGAEADAAALRRAAGAPLLHLAGHGGIGPAGPWLGLADGELDAATVIAERLAPQRVVLATCAGAARRGMGMWGTLGATFLAAGSETVIAALWSLDDEPARRFVLRFYRQGGADDPLGALARTQRASIAAGEPQAFWSPYVALGAAGPRDPA